MMKGKHLICSFAILAMVAFMASCGGSSGTAATGGGSAGTASTESVASTPTLDLSQYDGSTSTSANLAALLNKSASLSKSASLLKGFEDLDAVGNSSRAGCEANMHKQEIFRQSQQVQIPRCYIEAMEKAGFITIPDDSYAFYQVSPPEESAEERAAMCSDIPAEWAEEKAACQAGEGGGGGSLKLRVGRFSSELRMGICEGDSTTQNEELIVSASGDTYTADATHKGTFGGKSETGKFDIVVDLGSTGTVVDGIPTIGTEGFVTASGKFNGGFGSGSIGFEMLGSDSSNRAYGAFAGSFTDPFSNTASSFIGKAYARFGGSTAYGCARYKFTGSPPAMRLQDMIPFDIGSGQLVAFLNTLGAEFGISINIENYQSLLLCPNPNFDPETSNPTLVKPMVALAEGVTTCGSVSHTGLECFAIRNGTADAQTGLKSQTFIIIANSDANKTFYDEVNAYNIDSLDSTIDAIAFTHDWDCTGNFSTLDFQSFTPTQIATAQTHMETCIALETKARNNDGIGGYNCDEQQNMNGIDDIKDEGGSSTAFGRFGGPYMKNVGNLCVNSPDHIFINPIDPVAPSGFGTYCIASDGSCDEVEITGNNVGGLNISVGSYTLTALAFLAEGNNAPTSLTATFATCAATYIPEATTFTPGGWGEGSGDQAGEAGYMPVACVEAGFTTADDKNACQQLCAEPNSGC